VDCHCPSACLSQRKRRGDPLRSVASFKLVLAIKLMNVCITIPISSLLNCTAIPSNTLSRLNQKLISCNAMPDETSLMSLVTAWIAFIHVLMCEWRELRNVLSVRSFDGMWEMLGCRPCDWAFIQVSETSSLEERKTHQLNSLLNNRMNNQVHLWNLHILL